MKKVVIIGAGGHAREILDVFDELNKVKMRYDVLGYIVDRKYGVPGTLICGLPILGGFDWLNDNFENVFVVCGVGLPQLRFHLIKRAKEVGCNFLSIIHPNAVLTRWVELGMGVVVTAGCILTNNIRISDHVHINVNCTVGHDTEISEYATLSPGVHVSGNVKIEEGAFLGVGANIIEKISIGRWSIIGAGSVVLNNVKPNSTYVGVPAKIIKEHDEGWHYLNL